MLLRGFLANTVYPQVEDGEDSFQVCRIPVNILNKQPQTTDKVWLGGEPTACHSKTSMLQNVTQERNRLGMWTEFNGRLLRTL
jgi:hypothetical protein